jgi:hypothetical protein
MLACVVRRVKRNGRITLAVAVSALSGFELVPARSDFNMLLSHHAASVFIFSTCAAARGKVAG